jgi:methionyl-tRNA synthetase
MINIEDFGKIEIRAGKILEADVIEGSEKLLKLKVDFGPSLIQDNSEGKKERDIRQVLSGIKKYFSNPKDLVGITCAFVTNLEPRQIMGMESHAMIMASSQNSDSEEFFTLLTMHAPPGSKVK